MAGSGAINTDRVYNTDKKRVFFPIRSLINDWLDLSCLSWIYTEWAEAKKKNAEYPIFFLEASCLKQRTKIIDGQLDAVFIGEVGEDMPIGIGFYDPNEIDIDEVYDQLGERLFNYLLVTEKYEILAWINKQNGSSPVQVN